MYYTLSHILWVGGRIVSTGEHWWAVASALRSPVCFISLDSHYIGPGGIVRIGPIADWLWSNYTNALKAPLENITNWIAITI